MRTSLKTFLASAALAAIALPAAAAPPAPGYTPITPLTPVYFHCNGTTTKVSNVNAQSGGGIVGWNGTKPTASYTTGAGCGTLDTGFTGTSDNNTLYDAPFAGTYTGNLDTMTVRLWTADIGTSRSDDTFTLLFHLVIDDKTIITRSTPVTGSVIPSATGATRLVEFSIRKIGMMSEAENGEHTVQLSLESYVDANNNAWLFDAAEVDSGLVFNPTTMAATKVNRNG